MQSDQLTSGSREDMSKANALRLGKRKTGEGGANVENGYGPARPLQLTNTELLRKPLTIRDKLLQKDVRDLNPEILPLTVRVHYPDVNALHQFWVRVTPSEGIWKGGIFDFWVEVPENYNMVPPKVKCVTPTWHPNISYPGGSVCLSLLRVASLDTMGWTPTRSLKDIVLGLDALFGDLVNFDDALNSEASEEYFVCKKSFATKVESFIKGTYSAPSTSNASKLVQY